MKTLTSLLLGGIVALGLAGCNDEVVEKKTSEVKYETAKVVESRYNDYHLLYHVTFRCQHGKTLISDANSIEREGKKLWEKFDEGDEIKVPYTEICEVGYNKTKPEKNVDINRVVEINHQWDKAEKINKEEGKK